MKNLFFVSVAFSILSGTSLTAGAQNSFHFKNEIDNASETGPSLLATPAPLHFNTNSQLSISAGMKATKAIEKCTSLQFKYAFLLNREVEKLTNFVLYNFIDAWYGTRYRFGGTTKKGIDCSSLTEKLMKAVYSIDLPRTAKEQYAACTKIPCEEMAEGDLVFFNTRGGVSHVGFFLGDGYFVHASSSNGVMISQLEDPYYKHRFIGAGRVNAVGIDYTRILL